MKLLKKMLLINWHYIEHELIEFDTINFMTGKNAVGKSTILDALQLVMLGDTRGNFFNKAANDKGGRTLDGYLRGETGDNGDVGFNSLRKGRFTSYIALEFQDNINKKYTTFGVVFDSYQDVPTEHMFFIVNDQIPTNHYIDDENYPMDYKKLKSYFSRRYKPGQYNTYKESNRAYQTELLAKIGGVNPKFFNLFKKAVTFTPIDDIEKFISEYVCDVENTIDIYKMQENIRQYKELEKQAKVMQERKTMLEKIETNYQSYMQEVEKEYIQNYLIERSNLEITIEEIEEENYLLELNTKKIQQLQEMQKNLMDKLEKLRKTKEKLQADLNSSDIAKKALELEEKIKKLQDQIQELKEQTEKLICRFRAMALRWISTINQYQEKKKDEEETAFGKQQKILKDKIQYWETIGEQDLLNIQENMLQEIKEEMRQVQDFSHEVRYKSVVQLEQNKDRAEIVEQELKILKQGRKPYKTSLLNFRQALQQKLEEAFQEKVEVTILADVLEVKDIKWKDSIERYLNQQMFYLIVEPKYYEKAAHFYQQMAKENTEYSFGLIDVEKISQQKINKECNCLAEQVLTENKWATYYIDFLLGKVVCCDTVQELRQYRTAITPDCMLYKGYVLRKLQDKYNEFKFIGKKSMEEQIIEKEREISTLKKEQEKLEVEIQCSHSFQQLEVLNTNEIQNILSTIEQIKNREELNEQQKQYETEQSKLDLSWTNTLKQEIKEIEIQINEVETTKTEKEKEQTRLETSNNIIQSQNIPKLQNEKIQKQQKIELDFNQEWIELKGKGRFEKEMETKSASVIFKNFSDQIERTRKQKYGKQNALIDTRKEYVVKYQLSHEITNVTNNEEYTKELEKLRDIELPSYIEKIKDSEQKAYQQFQEDFLAKLKSNMDEVNIQIEELNDALKQSTFGTDKYHFNVKPKQEYRRFYDMITDKMLMEGNNLWSQSFQSKYAEEINELFKRITSSEILDENYEKNIKAYTDYKTYLSFDLAVTDKEGNTQHLSKTLNKKSGGETQTPFYVSVLASFAQLYKINRGRNDSTIRLIVFDEAFNKMDEERIVESIKLLKKFGFQAILSAPSEKAGEIIPLVSKTLCVIRKNQNTFVKEFSKETTL